MSKLSWKFLIASPAIWGTALMVSSAAIAAEQPVTQEVIQPQAAETTLSDSLALKPEQPITDAAKLAPSASVEMSNGSALSVMPPAEVKVAQSASDSNSNVLDQINRYSREGNNSQGVVTNVSQLRDVQPTDWAYQALENLVSRYGCIAGYPDGTFRGNRAMTRYEFAAGLNACLQQIEKLIAANGGDFATKQDLATLQKLVDDFGVELATLRTRVDGLDGRVTFLENHQFSTTTKLVGEAIFALTDTFGSSGSNTNTIFGDRVRLELQTSFTGRDILHTRLAAGNLGRFSVDPTGASFEGQQTFNISNNGNDIQLDWLAYEFPFGSSNVYVAATGGLHNDYAPVLNPYFYNADGGNGALSTFAQNSPIYRIGGGAGAGIRLGVGEAPILGPTSLSLGYLAANANNPGLNSGVFNGDYSALAQLNFTVNDRFALAATYVHGYHTDGNAIYAAGAGSTGLVGTSFANAPASLFTLGSGKAISNSYGLQAAFRFSDRFSLSGWAMKSAVRVLGQGDADIWSYGLGLAFPDLGKRGNVLGLFAGIEPTARGARQGDGTPVGLTRDYSYHVEGFYKYQLTDNISITPGVIWITAPNQNNANEDAVIGTVRTTFTF